MLERRGEFKRKRAGQVEEAKEGINGDGKRLDLGW